MEMPELSAEQLNLLFGYFPQCFCVIDLQGQIEKANPAFCRLVDYKETELQSRSFIGFIHPEDQQSSLEKIETLRQNKNVPSCENRFHTKAGGYKWLSWNCFKPAESNLIYCSIQDISELKLTKESLTKSMEENRQLLKSLDDAAAQEAEKDEMQVNDLLKTILQNYPDAFFTLNKEWKPIEFNKKAQRMLGKPAKMIKHSHFWALLPVSREHQFIKQAETALQTGQPFIIEEFNLNSNKWFEVTGYPYSDTLTLFFKDISIRKKHEQDLLQLARDYEVLFASNPLPMWAYDLDKLNILMVNDAALSLYGYTRPEFLNMNLYDLRPETEHERLKGPIKQEG
jgi:PAS domain S-box-containing protein